MGTLEWHLGRLENLGRRLLHAPEKPEFLTDAEVQDRYVRHGKIFGDAVSYLAYGECIGFQGLFAEWERWERTYADRGFRTISVDRFERAGGWDVFLDDVLGQKRQPREEPILHAERYRAAYLGKVQPVLRFGEFGSTTYLSHSTTLPTDPT